MKEKTIQTYIERCNDVVAKKMTRNAYCIANELSAGYFCNTWAKIYDQFQLGNISVDLWNQVAEVQAKIDSSYAIYTQNGKFDDEGNDYTNIDRDEAGKIISYSFKIGKKNRKSLIGKFTRDEMELVYRLYTNYGQGLTKKAIVKYFPEYSLEDFKRILNAWNVYKDSAPLPLHIIEEHTQDELLAIQARNKESDFVKKLDKIELQSIKNLLNKIQLENAQLKKQLSDRQTILSELNIEETYNKYSIVSSNETDDIVGIIVISDLHVGAFNVKNGYIPLEDYNEDEIRRRLTKIVEFAINSNWTSIIIVNLGDGIDSYKKETTRGGHELPTVMNDKEMSHLYQKLMMEFFTSLNNEFGEDIKYYCVGESNHPGDWGWINDVLLAEKLKNLGIESYISDTPIFNFNINNVTVTGLHGKNAVSQFKGFPLTLNDKTTNWFNNYYLDTDFDFKKKKVVIKGDLHQYAVTKAQNFDYISMPSIYGSSEYIVANFGKTRWACGYLTIDGNNVSSGVIED